MSSSSEQANDGFQVVLARQIGLQDEKREAKIDMLACRFFFFELAGLEGNFLNCFNVFLFEITILKYKLTAL